ncbi:MAG: glycosyltransferase family 4 protein [Prevotellaceae bacterium]|jgi:mannosyltransferase|nr:glycosyltransferase family 4 protein [Prevotellaceae bacterium]
MIILDNIIFNLQKTGGISVVWSELITGILNSDLDFLCLEYNSTNNLCRNKINLPSKNISHHSYPLLPVQRYFNPVIKQTTPFIFHSSYYRYSTNRNAVNITTVHDFTYEYFVKGLAQKIHSHQKKKAVDNSDGIICISENTKKDLLKFYPKTQEDKIKVIYNGVNNCFTPLEDLSELRTLIPFEEKSFLLYIGNRTSPYKNFNETVKIARLAKMPLVIVGNEAHEQERKELNELLGKENYILLSNLDAKKINLLYNAAFCLLYLSVYEGFGIPIVEAQRANCPVLCLNTSSIPEVAGNGAIVLEKFDVQNTTNIIQEMKNGRIDIAAIVKKGNENSLRFSWEKTYCQTMDFYKIFNSIK